MNLSSFLGFFAAFCTTVALVPQAVKVYKTRQTRDISLGMFSLMTTGVFFWLIYGIMRGDIPLIMANAVTLIFSIYILIMKIAGVQGPGSGVRGLGSKKIDGDLKINVTI